MAVVFRSNSNMKCRMTDIFATRLLTHVPIYDLITEFTPVNFEGAMEYVCACNQVVIEYLDWK